MWTREFVSQLGSTLALVLAGGRGERLYPLTQDRTKGAVPFAGLYRLIDFTLSNCLHSGLHRVCVLPQYKFASLERHLRLGWGFPGSPMGEGLAIVPPQQRINQEWYRGTADAIYQNIYTLRQFDPEYALVLSSDHIYRMDYRHLLEYHACSAAELTIACTEVPIAEAGRFGALQVDERGRVLDFVEKAAQPPALPGRPDRSLVSMGIYVFDAKALVEILCDDARHPESRRDFGRDIIPRMVREDWAVQACDVQTEEERDGFYWRDIGDIDAYWRASMELLESEPPFRLEDPEWPIHTYFRRQTPTRVGAGEAGTQISETLVCPGVELVDARVQRSILSPGVRLESGAQVSDSVLMDGVRVGAGAQVHRAIIDKHVHIPPGYRIGVEPARDRLCFHVSPAGITTLSKQMQVGAIEVPGECTVVPDLAEVWSRQSAADKAIKDMAFNPWAG